MPDESNPGELRPEQKAAADAEARAIAGGNTLHNDSGMPEWMRGPAQAFVRNQQQGGAPTFTPGVDPAVTIGPEQVHNLRSDLAAGQDTTPLAALDPEREIPTQPMRAVTANQPTQQWAGAQGDVAEKPTIPSGPPQPGRGAYDTHPVNPTPGTTPPGQNTPNK